MNDYLEKLLMLLIKQLPEQEYETARDLLHYASHNNPVLRCGTCNPKYGNKPYMADTSE